VPAGAVVKRLDVFENLARASSRVVYRPLRTSSPLRVAEEGVNRGVVPALVQTATIVGVVGKDLDEKAGREAAYTAALNVLAPVITATWSRNMWSISPERRK
jgi:hypothetical protein